MIYSHTVIAFSFDSLVLSLRINLGNFCVKYSVARVILLSSISSFITADSLIAIISATDFLLLSMVLLFTLLTT